ncbi:hypothetical protein ARMGADRAFT_160827 [Armillaria gallica]|uniref:Uncharacterized protein n=1 Tax=Armillaria gallica TaxID=47427 RepID=A0A2H3DVZ4_ARMGA|nr:hypothetical protein ARMGADRAFT_160827 [Armillaria gallica]
MAPARKKISHDNKENIAVASQQRRTRTAPVAMLEKAAISTITSLRRSKRSRRPLSRLDDNVIPAKVLPHCDAQNYLHEDSPHYSTPKSDLYSLPFQSAFDISTEILPDSENYPYSPLIDPFCDLHTLFRDSEVSFKQPPLSPFFFVPYFAEGEVRLIPLQSNTFPRPRPQTSTGIKTHLKPCSDSLFFLDAFPDELLPSNSEVDPFEDVAKMSPGFFCTSVGFARPDEDGYDWAL